MKPGDDRGLPRFLPLFLGAALLIYFRTLGHGFIWDDDFYLFKNPVLDGLGGLRDIWFSHKTVQYYPMVFTSFWVEKRLWGLNPAGYHAVNLLIHGLNAYLLFRVVARLHRPAALLTGLLFLVHPLQVETVSWITERKNLLCLLFFLLAFRSQLLFQEREEWRFYFGAFLFFCLSLLSKSVAVCFVAVPFLLTWIEGRRLGWRDVRIALPFVVAGLAAGAHTSYLEYHRVGAHGAEWTRSLVERFLLAGSILWFDVYKTVFPWKLCFVYPKWTVAASRPVLWVSAALVLGVAGFLYSFRRNCSRLWLASGAFFVVSIFPALGFVNLYPMRYSYVQDHFVYLSMPALIGFLIVGPWLWLRDRVPGWAPWALVLLLGLRSYAYVPVFRDEETLWTDVIQKNPSAWIAANNLGLIDIGRGNPAAAEARFRQAVAIDPGSYEAQNNLGFALQKRGKFPEAQARFEAALKIMPDYADAAYNLANNFLALGRAQEAETWLGRTLAIDPGYWEALNGLGGFAFNRGRLDLAESYYLRAIAADGKHYQPYQNLAVVYLRKGEASRGDEMMKEALRIKDAKPD